MKLLVSTLYLSLLRLHARSDLFKFCLKIEALPRLDFNLSGKMLSHQQQNPHAVPYYSLQHQQMGSKEINSEGQAHVKSFSIRQYVVGWRQKSIVQSWPFPEKYLQMCIDHGVRNVLPAFGLHSNSVHESSSLNGFSDLKSSDQDQDDDKNAKVFKCEAPDHIGLEQKQQQHNIIMKLHDDNDPGLFSNEERSKVMVTKQLEEGNWCNSDCVGKSSQQILNCSSKAISKDKRRRRRKGKCKKKSMVEILAVAKHCTLEEINRINQFSFTTGTDQINNIEGCHCPLENNSKYQLPNQ